ncbi:MAG: endonuclease/exonuclease/phosphatase family protein [Pseudomonadota bacterium]|nr:endonuclease/exonuclease/phosphatase family protein [Pseudomonadota bacterium]
MIAAKAQAQAPAPAAAGPWPPAPAAGAIRVAVFNASLSRRGAGLIWKAILDRKDQARAVAAILRDVRPDVVALLELDRDAEGLALDALAALLAEAGEDGTPGLAYPHRLAPPVNTGLPTGLDLDRDGDTAGPGDAQGYGAFPGQYGLAVLSRLPLDVAAARSFRLTLWADMPGGLMPTRFYPPEAAGLLRLSSKTHLDLPAILPDGRRLHLLVSHPTPPVFDGAEDRNGRRNHDEIRFWTDYVSGAGWMRDDAGRAGGLAEGAGFVILGDLNADPEDGDGRREAIRALLSHARVRDPAPTGPGGGPAAAAQGGANARHRGEPGRDTADWRDEPGPGNLRVDFALPSTEWEVTGAGVWWPAPDDPRAALIEGGRLPASSDHRLVWVDIR